MSRSPGAHAAGESAASSESGPTAPQKSAGRPSAGRGRTERDVRGAVAENGASVYCRKSPEREVSRRSVPESVGANDTSPAACSVSGADQRSTVGSADATRSNEPTSSPAPVAGSPSTEGRPPSPSSAPPRSSASVHATRCPAQ